MGKRKGQSHSKSPSSGSRADVGRENKGVSTKTLVTKEAEKENPKEVVTEIESPEKSTEKCDLNKDNTEEMQIEGTHEEMSMDLNPPQDKNRQAWTTLFKRNRVKTLDCDLDYVIPVISKGKRVGKFHSEETRSEAEHLKNSLLGCVFGAPPNFFKLRSFVFARWKEFGLQSVHQVNQNLFIFRFECVDGLRQVLEEGPVFFDRKPLIVRAWEPYMKLEDTKLVWKAKIVDPSKTDMVLLDEQIDGSSEEIEHVTEVATVNHENMTAEQQGAEVATVNHENMVVEQQAIEVAKLRLCV
ncbi:hypothetical protein ACFE04_026476 [Oxalis oulophora]